MKVYVVTTGCYSDYSIHSIWSSREKAQAYITDIRSRGLGQYGCPEFNDIDEHELDVIVADKAIVRATVYMSDGAEHGHHLYESDDTPPVAGEVYDRARRYKNNDWSNGWDESIVSGVGRTLEHALKSARDHRAKILAQRAGIA